SLCRTALQLQRSHCSPRQARIAAIRLIHPRPRSGDKAPSEGARDNPTSRASLRTSEGEQKLAAPDRRHAVPNAPFEAQQRPSGDAYGLLGQLYIDVAPKHLNGGRAMGFVLLNRTS